MSGYIFLLVAELVHEVVKIQKQMNGDHEVVNVMLLVMCSLAWVDNHFLCIYIYFFGWKAGVLLIETKVYITLVTALGLHSLVSPKADRSLIYGTSTKLGQCS